MWFRHLSNLISRKREERIEEEVGLVAEFDAENIEIGSSDGLDEKATRNSLFSTTFQQLLRSSLNFLKAFLLFLIPTFLYQDPNHPLKKLHPTSYLDGLRGVAALFVACHHYIITWFPALSNGWKNTEGGAENNWIFQFPFLRVLNSGRFMVSIFFVISGYVLSHRSLTLAKRRKFDAVLDSLSSSVFRRWLRLMLPALASTFIGFVLARGQLFVNVQPGWDQAQPPSIRQRQNPTKLDTLAIQVWDYIDDSRQLIDPFRWSIYHARYNYDVLWTIQAEFTGSLIVFGTVLSLIKLRTVFKISILSCLALHCLYYVRWMWFLFLAGIILAELSVSRSESTSLLGPDSTPTKSSHLQMTIRILATIGFITSIYVGAHPANDPQHSLGFMWIMTLVPPQYASASSDWYPSLAAVLMLLCLENAPFLQKIFTTRLAQYLGEISFSLYMLHCHVLNTVAKWIVPQCLVLTGGWTQIRFAAGFTMGMFVAVPITFWASDLFTRAVDMKAVKLARWLYIKCLIKD
jgi:peptidoglycan/LPS O-acetylase OafA/YrhL